MREKLCDDVGVAVEAELENVHVRLTRVGKCNGAGTQALGDYVVD